MHSIESLLANTTTVAIYTAIATRETATITTMGSNDLVVGEDDLLGPSGQRYNW